MHLIDWLFCGRRFYAKSENFVRFGGPELWRRSWSLMQHQAPRENELGIYFSYLSIWNCMLISIMQGKWIH